MAKEHKDRDLNDLMRSVLYEELPNQNLMRLTIIVIGVAFSLFIGWASFTNVNEVTRSSGEIIPSGYAQVVQHLEGGIVSEILVREGDLVDKGQVLARMGGVGAEEDLGALKKQQVSLQLQAERLRALAYDKEPDFESFEERDAKAIEHQRQVLTSTRNAYKSEKNVLRDQLAQKKNVLIRLQNQYETEKKELSGAAEILSMRRDLAKRGNTTKRDLIASESEVNRIEGKMQATTSQIAEANQAINEYNNRIRTLKVRLKDNALKDLETVQNNIIQNKEKLVKLSGRVNRMEIRSPARGIVKGLKINTIGGVISSGQAIMEIVPLDSILIVEARIPPSDIGTLKVGQHARVKVSAYDFSRYGVIDGTLEFLSATTFVDDKNESYYKGKIALSRGFVGNNPMRNLVLPGMTVEVDITTGEKTVLAYLLKPIHRSLTSAFQER